jgi:hypothetical protein
MMLPRWGALVVVTWASLVVACSDDSSSSQGAGQDAGNPQDAGSPQDAGASLDPTSYDRTCATETDCLLVSPMEDCVVTCCGTQAVRDTPQVRSEVESAGKACPTKTTCTKACTPVVTACVSGKCEVREVDAGADGG